MVPNLRTTSFQELIAFIEVVRQGGVTAAAETLGIAKSAVSNQISKLEQQLGVKLLNRSSRRVSLTKEGEILLPRVESLLAEGQQLFELAEQEEKTPQGTVRIAATTEFAQWVLADMLIKARRQYPEIRIIVKTAYNFEDLQDPSFDLAFRINQVKDDRLVAKKLGQFYRRFYANPSLPLLDQLTHPEQLSNWPCLAFSDATTSHVWNAYHQTGKAQANVAINAISAIKSFNALVHLCASGQGICFVPSIAAEAQVKQGQLIQVLPNWHSAPAEVFLVYRQGASQIARIKAILDLASDLIPEKLSEN